MTSDSSPCLQAENGDLKVSYSSSWSINRQKIVISLEDRDSTYEGQRGKGVGTTAERESSPFSSSDK